MLHMHMCMCSISYAFIKNLEKKESLTNGLVKRFVRQFATIPIRFFIYNTMYFIFIPHILYVYIIVIVVKLLF